MRYARTLRVTVAVLASAGVHFAAAMVAAPPEPPVLVAGGATAEIAALGSNFEDLLEGSDVLQPAEALETDAVQPVDALRPTPAVVKAANPTAQPVAAVPPVVTASAAPVAARVPVSPSVTGSVAVPAAAIAKAEPVETPQPATPGTAPAEVASLSPAKPAETVTPEPELAVPVPIARPEPPARPKPTVVRKAEKKGAAPAPNTHRGNASRDSRAGKAEGQRTAQKKTGGGQRAGKASVAGNAAASNYPGKVYSKIRRTRQQRAGGSGVTRIRFSIASSGALASISVASSSGSSSVDNAALGHIRRSAPFPPPPAGARRQFVIPVEVRR